jgi:hypothetical protein
MGGVYRLVKHAESCERNYPACKGVTMKRVSVRIKGLPSEWASACRHAVKDLNAEFKKKHVNVILEADGVTGPVISIRTDASIQGTAVHGRTHAEFDGSGMLISAEVRLPVEVIMSTPARLRNGGAGVLEVIAGHEFVHALGHEPHNTHLMSQTLYKEAGDRPAQDRLKAGTIYLPPLVLSEDSVSLLQSVWN